MRSAMARILFSSRDFRVSRESAATYASALESFIQNRMAEETAPALKEIEKALASSPTAPIPRRQHPPLQRKLRGVSIRWPPSKGWRSSRRNSESSTSKPAPLRCRSFRRAQRFCFGPLRYGNKFFASLARLLANSALTRIPPVARLLQKVPCKADGRTPNPRSTR